MICFHLSGAGKLRHRSLPVMRCQAKVFDKIEIYTIMIT